MPGHEGDQSRPPSSDGVSVRFEYRSDLSAVIHESNYSIYSINDGFEDQLRGISELGCLVSTPWTHKSFIDKRRLTSQAGRRTHLPKKRPGSGPNKPSGNWHRGIGGTGIPKCACHFCHASRVN